MTRALDACAKLPWERKTPFKGPELIDTTLLVTTAEGKVYLFEKDGWYPLPGEFAATGTGMDAALAAMYLGADAPKAVRVACKVDKESGLPVNVIRLSDL